MICDLKPYPAYKDFCVPWLGKVPAHWEVRRQRHAAEMRVSNVDKHSIEEEHRVRLCNYVDVYKNDRITCHIPFMQATATREEIDRFNLRVGDVLITKDSESWNDIAVPALVEWSASDLVCGYHLALLRPYKEVVLGAYLFRAHQSQAVSHQYHVAAAGVTRYGLSHDAIKSIILPIPSLPEQFAIARFLDHADRRIRRYIRAKRKLIALLNEQKQAIIHRAVTRGLNPKVRLKPSGAEWLGEVPEHWEIWRSKRLFSPRGELARSTDTQLSATQAYGVIPQDEYERRVGRKIVKIFRHLEKRRHVEVGDFVISMRSFQGGLERAWAAGCIRSSYIVLQPTERVDVNFFSYVFKSSGYIGALQSTANFIRDGQDLNFDNFCAVDLAVPPLEEQRLIARSVKESIASTVEATESARKEIDLLAEYRTRLIDDVVTGKLDVREAAARLPHEAEEPEPLNETEVSAEDGDDGEDSDFEAASEEAVA